MVLCDSSSQYGDGTVNATFRHSTVRGKGGGPIRYYDGRYLSGCASISFVRFGSASIINRFPWIGVLAARDNEMSNNDC